MIVFFYWKRSQFVIRMLCDRAICLGSSRFFHESRYLTFIVCLIKCLKKIQHNHRWISISVKLFLVNIQKWQAIWLISLCGLTIKNTPTLVQQLRCVDNKKKHRRFVVRTNFYNDPPGLSGGFPSQRASNAKNFPCNAVMIGFRCCPVHSDNAYTRANVSWGYTLRHRISPS